MKPTDKAILGMVSKSPGRNKSEPRSAMPVKDVVLRVDPHKAPTGADLLVDVVVAGVKVITGVKIAAGATVGSTLAFAELGFVPADTPVSIDITQVGSTFPGERLVASVRF